MPSVIQNEGFETDDVWEEVQAGGGVADRHVAGGHSGSWEGKTDTTSPSNDSCLAQLGQGTESVRVDEFTDSLGTLGWWTEMPLVAAGGEESAEVVVRCTDMKENYYNLHYYYRLRSQSLPSDTSTDKYIDMGTTLPAEWTQVNRNFYSDWLNKFGVGLLSLYVTRLVLISYGQTTMGLYGQDIRWDDITFNTLGGAFPSGITKRVDSGDGITKRFNVGVTTKRYDA